MPKKKAQGKPTPARVRTSRGAESPPPKLAKKKPAKKVAAKTSAAKPKAGAPKSSTRLSRRKLAPSPRALAEFGRIASDIPGDAVVRDSIAGVPTLTSGGVAIAFLSGNDLVVRVDRAALAGAVGKPYAPAGGPPIEGWAVVPRTAGLAGSWPSAVGQALRGLQDLLELRELKNALAKDPASAPRPALRAQTLL